MKKTLKIGTRQSRLAMAQTEMACDVLRRAHPDLAEDGAIEIVPIVTTGDKSQKSNKPLCEKEGGKALFAKELEDALNQGHIDLAVHSMKDIPGQISPGFIIPAYLPREDARDVFFSPHGDSLADLPTGAVLGTASPRRRAIALSHRPDLQVKVLRGNVETRLQKLADGFVDATFLAAAGLNRLGLQDRIQTILSPDDMLPAVGQGAVGFEVRGNDTELIEKLKHVHDRNTGLCVAAERGFLRIIDGTCKTSVAGYATLDDDDMLTVRVMAVRPDGTQSFKEVRTVRIGDEASADALGVEMAHDIKSQLPDGFFDI